MSIHKSKGLEFPIVFLANTSKNYNFQDSRKSVVFHIDLGIGTMQTDKKRRIKYSTLARSAIQNKLNNEMLSEELRVLYVAMTRAKERLVITAALKDATKTREKIKALPPGKVAPQLMRSMRSMAEWILAGTREINEGDVMINAISAEALQRKDLILSTVIAESDASETKAEVDASGVKTEVDVSLFRAEMDASGANAEVIAPEILSNFNFDYPFESSTILPSKLTVTGLISQTDPEADRAAWTREEHHQAKTFSIPDFISKKQKMSAAERGILLHLIMQHIDHNMLSPEPNIADIDKQLQLLVFSGCLLHEQVDEVDKQKIVRFFQSAIGSRVIKAKKLYREFKFSILRPARDYFPGGSTDEILVQGVVDCFFEEEGEIVLLDFKTDKVTDINFKEKAKFYTPQLVAYADALKRITGKHVKDRIIYFFAIDTECPV
jgi:ATP-dependent helicase/nuclease subunit A